MVCVNCAGGMQARLDGAINPGMLARRVFASKINPAFGFDDVGMQPPLLSRLEKRKSSARVFIAVPEVRCADFEFVDNLRVNGSRIFQCLPNALFRWQRAPALSVLSPGVAGQDDPASRLAAVVWIVHRADRQVGLGAAAKDAVVIFPEPPPALKQ